VAQSSTRARRGYPGHRNRHAGAGEARLPPTLAILVAAALYASLPNELVVGPRFVIPVLEGILLIALVATDPRRITRQTRLSRTISLALISVIVLTNLLALGQLVHDLVSAQVKGGGALLLAALQVWATNVIAFALIYWELDRGGPASRVKRPRAELPLADFRFSHDEDRDTVIEVSAGSSEKSDWMPTFIDYLYVSTTNSSAFSPTDTMPLSSRMKMLMAVQATAALITSLLVIARAVSALQ
jgi:hypothetical protein